MSSNTSATSTNKVMTSAVKNSPIAAAATIAIVIDSSMVMRRSTIFSKASLTIGQPPIANPRTPITLIRERLQDAEPHGRRSKADDGDANGFRPPEGVVVFVFLAVILAVVEIVGKRDFVPGRGSDSAFLRRISEGRSTALLQSHDR